MLSERREDNGDVRLLLLQRAFKKEGDGEGEGKVVKISYSLLKSSAISILVLSPTAVIRGTFKEFGAEWTFKNGAENW